MNRSFFCTSHICAKIHFMKKEAIIYTENALYLWSLLDYLAANEYSIHTWGLAAALIQDRNILFTNERELAENRGENRLFTLITQILQSKDNEIICINRIPHYSEEENEKLKDYISDISSFRTSELLHAAIKNWRNLIILTDPDDYKDAIIALKTQSLSEEFKMYLAGKALNLLSALNGAISDSILQISRGVYFPPFYTTCPAKSTIQISSMNMVEKAALYNLKRENGVIRNMKLLQGSGADYDTILNFYVAIKSISLFSSIIKQPFTVPSFDRYGHEYITQFTPQAGSVFTVAIKNTSPIGAAMGESVADSFSKTFKCEAENFENALLASSAVVDEEAAKQIVLSKLSTVVAPTFSEGALKIFSYFPYINVLSASSLIGNLNEGIMIDDALLLKTADHTLFNKWRVVSNRRPTQRQCDALAFAMIVAISAHSDAAVVASHFTTMGVSSAFVNKSDATKWALRKANRYIKENPVQDEDAIVLVSDSSIPFNEETTNFEKCDVGAILQSGGDENDEAFINFCNENNIAMIFTSETHFSL